VLVNMAAVIMPHFCYYQLVIIIFLVLLWTSDVAADPLLTPKVRMFYYLWYGTPEHNGGEYRHWNHEVLPHWHKHINARFPEIGSKHNAPHEIHSPFFPFMGPYSSISNETIYAHCELISQSGSSLIIASWWGKPSNPHSKDSQGVNTDYALTRLFDVVETFNQARIPAQRVSIAMHLEPYHARSALSIRDDIGYIIENYGSYHSLYRDNISGKPLFYVYDSYHIPPGNIISCFEAICCGVGVFYLSLYVRIVVSDQWRRLLSIDGDLSIRGTSLDVLAMGLWLEESHGEELVRGNFDGIYTYFAVDGFR
jgi:glycoprotein endo-alpha-1,2-mannosidase